MSATDPLLGAVKARPRSRETPRALAGAERPAAAHVAAAAALAVTLALAGAVAVFGGALLIIRHSETLEAIWWLTGFGVVAPLAALATGRLLAWARTPAERSALLAAAPCTLLTLCATLVAVRAAGALPAGLLPAALAPAPALLMGRRRLAALADRPDARALAALATGAAGLLGVAAFLPSASRGAGVIVLAVPLAAIAVPIVLALRGRTLDPRARLALGVLIPVVLALLAWDVSFQPLTSHQDFYLGPVNDIRHGRYMLVDDYSQYGVGVIYFLAAVLAPLPFGYGSFVLVLGLQTAFLLATVYLVLRVATRSLALAGLGAFAALMAGSIATIGRSAQYPSTGFLRFGIPWLLVCALVLAHRRESRALPPMLVAYALVGVAAVWSFETAFSTVATFVVTIAVAAWTGPPGERMRRAVADLAGGTAATIVAIAAFVTATELGRNRMPNLGGYLDFLRLYSVDGFGQLPIPGWSLGYLMGALYVASLTAVWAIVRHARDSELARSEAIVPLTAVSTFGAVALTYFLGRSHPNNLTHVAPPFVAMLTLWTAPAWRAWGRHRSGVAGAAVLLASACTVVLVCQQLPQLVAKAPDSALVAVARGATGGRGLAQRLETLTAEPVISSHTPVVEALVRAHVPRRAPLLVAVEPAVATETLIRLNRSDVLPISTPEQDGLPLRRRQALVRDAAGVPCGTYVVTQDAPLTGPGRILLEGLVAHLRRLHPLRALASTAGYHVFRVGCG